MHHRIRNEQFKWKTVEIKLLILYDNVCKTLSVYFHQNLDITEGDTPVRLSDTSLVSLKGNLIP